MQRIQPSDTVTSTTSNGDVDQSKEITNDDARKMVTAFSWDMAVNYFERLTKERMGKSDIYFMDDGLQIKDGDYICSVTAEICREFGFELLNILTDLILPVGFDYPSLNKELDELVTDAFKPVSRMVNRKTVVWIEDEQWNMPGESIVELLVRELLLERIEPFLIAPMKYFDKEVMPSVFKVLSTTSSDTGEDGAAASAATSEDYWLKFSSLLKFGFLLTLRSSTFPIILLHFGQKLAEKVDAGLMTDLAKAEGHEIKYIKNTPSIENKEVLVTEFVSKLVSGKGAISKKMKLDNMS